MINKIWFFMVLTGILYSLLVGNYTAVNDVILNNTSEAVTFAIGLTGIMATWLGLMKIAEKSGLINALGRCISPVMKVLFPGIPKNHPANSAIIMNVAANMFGAGNSATALGLKAMEELQSINKDKKTASNAMIMFLVINMSSVQLIPLTVLKVRADTGSLDPTEIIISTIIATLVSTIVGVGVCKLMEVNNV